MTANYEFNYVYDTTWQPPDVFPDLTNSKNMAIDLETCDPNIKTRGPGWPYKDGYIVGFAIAAGDFAGYYPIAHAGGGNIDKNIVLRWVKKQLATPDIPKIMHNAMYDAGWLQTEGIEVQGKIIDTMIAAPLVDENRFSYSLDALGKHYLDMRKDERTLKERAAEFGFDAKADLWRMPSQFVGEYAEMDAVLTLRLWEHLSAIINKEELTSVFELETGLIPVVLEMRRRGVRVDLDIAEQAKEKLNSSYNSLWQKIYKETNVELEPWAAASVAQVFDSMDLHYNKTKTDQPSFTKQFLNEHSHPIAKKIVRLRELDKAKSTFIETILNYEHKGRIHAEFHALRSDDGGTVTGRFSSSHPNLQQIPARDPEIKKLIRGLFLPEEGEKWGSFDYSSQEPRLLVHFCGSLPDKFRHPKIEGVIQEYNEGDPDFHQMVADMADISRKDAKTVNLGIMYGMGQKKLAGVLGVSIDEAKELLGQYHVKVPFVKDIADIAMKQGQDAGQVRTILGRRCRFDMWEPKSYQYNKPMNFDNAIKNYGGKGMIRRAFTYKALNRLIQGSAADQTKKAMLECYKAGYQPLLQVHDELCFSIKEGEEKDIAEIMETCVDLLVPSKVDVAIADNWGDVD